MDNQTLLETAAQHFQQARPLIPMYIHLIVSALFPIYTGAHASLSRPSSAAKPVKKSRKPTDAEDEDEDEEDAVQKMEGLSPKDAIVFPASAAVVLTGLYFLIKRYGAKMVNLILGWYFSGIGIYSVGRLVNDAANILVSLVFPTYFAGKGKLWKVDGAQRKAVAQDGTAEAVGTPIGDFKLPQVLLHYLWDMRMWLKQKYTTKAYIHDVVDFKANLTRVSVFSVAASIASIAYANFVAKPWWLTNLQGFAVCYSAMQFMSPTTFATGSLILGGLFCYDIWAVFFTPLMVTVAKNLDVPIKLVFPRPDEPSKTPGEAPIKSFSMLGLGDIVLPGIMIALALRFDLYMFYLRKQKKRQTSSNPSRADATEEAIEKAPYVPVTGALGDRLHTVRLPAPVKPDRLNVSFPRPYFMASMVGYVLGMLVTLGVMSVFQHAQPALLYLVPGVLISLWGTGLVRGELKQMWEFTEAVTGEQVDGGNGKEGEDAAKEADDRTWFQKLKDEFLGTDKDAGGKKDGLNGPASDEKQRPDADAKDAKPKERGSNLIFGFSVTRYRPSMQQDQHTAGDQSRAEEKKTDENDAGARTSTPSDSSMEDTVLVESN